MWSVLQRTRVFPAVCILPKPRSRAWKSVRSRGGFIHKKNWCAVRVLPSGWSLSRLLFAFFRGDTLPLGKKSEAQKKCFGSGSKAELFHFLPSRKKERRVVDATARPRAHVTSVRRLGVSRARHLVYVHAGVCGGVWRSGDTGGCIASSSSSLDAPAVELRLLQQRRDDGDETWRRCGVVVVDVGGGTLPPHPRGSLLGPPSTRRLCGHSHRHRRL